MPAILPCPVLGEEMNPAEQQALWDQAWHDGIWVVDPIDGTTNFVHGLPYFAISVAWMREGRTELGVIYNPVADEMFYAQRGHGAYLNGVALPLTGSPATLTRKPLPQSTSSTCAVAGCPAACCRLLPLAACATSAHPPSTGAMSQPAATTFTCMADSGCGTTQPER